MTNMVNGSQDISTRIKLYGISQDYSINKLLGKHRMILVKAKNELKKNVMLQTKVQIDKPCELELIYNWNGRRLDVANCGLMTKWIEDAICPQDNIVLAHIIRSKKSTTKTSFLEINIKYEKIL